MQSTVLLFDIDGTLIRCGGAGGQSLCAALGEEFNLPEVEPVPLHGRTDLGIINELLSKHGIESNQENRSRLCDRYYSKLPSRLKQLSDERSAHVLPGVSQLLGHLTSSANCVLALLTGNMPTSARIKLEHFGLWSYFRFGVYGDLTDHRPRLASPAHSAIADYFGQSAAPRRVVVIGDTPLDVELASTMQARSLAVCTGGFSQAELLNCGADWVLDNLADTQAVVDWLLQTH
jgi:phosphoglycolate phosphatase